MSAESTRLRPQVILLGVLSLFNDIASEIIYPLLPLFLTGVLGATALQVGAIEGTAEGMSSILKLIAGRLSDRWKSRKPLIMAGYGMATLSRALIAAAVAWPMIFAARLLDRAGKGIRSAPRDALIAEVTPREQLGRAFGFHRAMDNAGAVIGPLLAALLMSVLHFGIRSVFWIAVVPGAIGVLLIGVLLKEPPPAPAASKGTDSWRLAPGLWKPLLPIALFALANSSDAFLILQAHRAGVATALIPLLWAAHNAAKTLLSTPAGSLSDRMDRRIVLVAGWFCYAIAYAVFPHVRSTAAFALLFVFYALPFALTEGTERAWLSEKMSGAGRGTALGYYYLVSGIGVLAGTLLFGAIYQQVSPLAAFYVGAGLAVAACLASTVAGRSTPLA